MRPASADRRTATADVYGVGGWKGAHAVAVLMMAVIAVRLHELVPGTAVLKPGLLAAVGGSAIILWRSTPTARAALARHPLFRLTTAYWIVMIITLPFALWKGLAFGGVQFFLPGVALVVALLLCPPRERSLVAVQAGFVGAAALYALYVKLFGRVIADGRLSAGFGMYDSNDMAALLGLVFPLAVGLVLSSRGKLRTAAAAAALLLAWVVIASGSRGGALGIAAGTAVLAFGFKGVARVGALTLFMAAGLGLWTFAPDFRDRMSSLTSLEDDYNTTHEVGRKAVWARGRDYIRQRPLVGVGVGNFPVAEGRYFDRTFEGTRGGKWSSAHNAYIQAYAELGVIGGSLFIAVLLYGLRVGWRMWRGVRVPGGRLVHRPEYLASLVTFMTAAIFLSHAYFLPAFALLGIIALADRTLLPQGAGLQRRHRLLRGMRVPAAAQPGQALASPVPGALARPPRRGRRP